MAPFAGQISVGTGSCDFGCTDSLAVNYDPTALVDDGSCAYPCTDTQLDILVNTDFYGDECSWDITDVSVRYCFRWSIHYRLQYGK